MNPSAPWKRAETGDALTIGSDAEALRSIALSAAAQPSAASAPSRGAPAKPLRAIVIALAVSALLWALIARLL
jgi:hypothetical protein